MTLLAFCALAASGCRKKAGTPGGTDSEESVAQQIARELGQAIVQPPADKIALKVFYAGADGTDRARDFGDFLAANFIEAGRGDYARFRPEQAAGYDVVILDYDGLGLDTPVPDLPKDYARATLTMGVPGADIGSRLRLKTGYL